MTNSFGQPGRDPFAILPSAKPRAWVLLGTHGGDNAQLLSLSRSLGWPYELKSGVDSRIPALFDRLAHGLGWPVKRRKPYLASLLWPDLILISGGRRVVDALRIKEASAGRSKIVCIGRPWADLDLFDLIITTPQYRLPARPNILQNTMPLNQATTGALTAAADQWRRVLGNLPRPWIALLVGGRSGSCRFSPADAARLGQEANAIARSFAGSLLISTSGRTPKRSADALLERIDAPSFAYRWDVGPAHANPYLGFLALADRFIVTSDSASMVAEACATGKPVTVFDIPQRLRTLLLTRPFAANRRGLLARWGEALTVRGLWIPARDMKAFHERLRDLGHIARAQTQQPANRLSDLDDLERALAAVRALFPHLPPVKVDDERRDANDLLAG